MVESMSLTSMTQLYSMIYTLNVGNILNFELYDYVTTMLCIFYYDFDNILNFQGFFTDFFGFYIIFQVILYNGSCFPSAGFSVFKLKMEDG